MSACLQHFTLIGCNESHHDVKVKTLKMFRQQARQRPLTLNDGETAALPD